MMGMGTGTQTWAITLADLAILLFMITAADLSNAQQAAHSAAPPAGGASAMVATAEPVAVFRPASGTGTGALKAWLTSQPSDPRQRLTILVRHPGSDADAALQQGLALSHEAELAGRPARLIVEQATAPEVAAFLAYDSDPQSVAHKLLGTEHEKNPE